MIRPREASPATRLSARPAGGQRANGVHAGWLTHRGGIRAGYAVRFASRCEKRYLLVAAESIDWLEAAGHATRAHVGARSHRLPHAIGRLEALLDPWCFARIHRSIIVNLTRIASVRAARDREYLIALHDGTTLRSSCGYAGTIRQLLGFDPRSMAGRETDSTCFSGAALRRRKHPTEEVTHAAAKTPMGSGFPLSGCGGVR